MEIGGQVAVQGCVDQSLYLPNNSRLYQQWFNIILQQYFCMQHGNVDSPKDCHNIVKMLQHCYNVASILLTFVQHTSFIIFLIIYSAKQICIIISGSCSNVVFEDEGFTLCHSNLNVCYGINKVKLSAML